MHEKIVDYIGKGKIFLIDTKLVKYYLSIPSKGTDKINICINISDVLEENDIIDTYKQISNDSLCIITPIFTREQLDKLSNVTEEQFLEIDKCISLLINRTYKRLVNEKFNIDDKIKLVHHDNQQVFEDLFINKYDGRVEILDSIPEVYNDEELSNNGEILDSSVIGEQPIFNDLWVDEVEPISEDDSNLEENNEDIQDGVIEDNINESVVEETNMNVVENNADEISEEVRLNFFEEEQNFEDVTRNDSFNENSNQVVQDNVSDKLVKNELKDVPQKIINSNTITIEDTQSFIPTKVNEILHQDNRRKREPGFMAFVILGVISAVIALCGLYFIL